MLHVMILAHLLGDYLFQWEHLVRWKERSLKGVLAHGVIVTLTAIGCALLTAPTWWPYALLIGMIHTVVDVVRARYVRTTDPTREFLWYLLDQLAHLIVIVLVARFSGPGRWELRAVFPNMFEARVLHYLIGYILLLNPAWVFLRFTVRAVLGKDSVPHLGCGEKFMPMAERVLIATFTLGGYFYLVPLVLLPRCLMPTQVEKGGSGVLTLARPSGHSVETGLSVVVAVIVGLALRMIGMG